ncbi:MAG: sugar phosphate isomerase/epimerase family protein [Methanocorpusculum sp.]|nr:sugar phosphate isomerase/epimerase family protein [Methanocorpusculum sp.]
MKIYFASSSKVWEDPAWVSEICDVGFDGWEISADGNYRLDKPDTFAAVKNVIKETGLDVSVHAPFSDLNPASINMPIWEETVNQLAKTITAAAELTDTVVIHPGYLSPVSRYDSALAWQNHKRACVRLGETARRAGVAACLENMPNLDDFFCREPYEQDGFVEGSGMYSMLDVGHANTTGNLADFCKIILPAARHLHIHDNHGGRDEHLPLGDGTIPWEKIMPKLVSGYRGKIIVVEGRNPKEGKKSLEFLRKWF